jgi:hypothetical protein
MNNLKSLSFLAALIVIAISFSGCSKNDNGSPSGPTQKLTLHVHNVAGNDLISYDSVYTDNTGRNYLVTSFQYYMSNIRLVKNDGTEYPLTGLYVLISPVMLDYDLGEVPVGDYKGIRFYIGVDSATNHSDPTTRPASDPLSLQNDPMHWDWSQGYLFMKLEGKVDTSAAGTGIPTKAIVMHLGLDKNYTAIDLSNSFFQIIQGSDQMIVMQCDVNQMFNNVDLRTDNQTHTFDNQALADELVANWPFMYSLQ